MTNDVKLTGQAERVGGWCYFDHNAGTPLSAAARQAFLHSAEHFPGNPSSPHRLGLRAENALAGAREAVAGALGCHPQEVVWTSGATESCATVFHHFAQILPPGQKVWVSGVEHPAVMEAGRALFGPRLEPVPVNRAGVVELDWLELHRGSRPPGLLAVMAANNETGVLQPWPQIQAWCRQAGVPFFCDATQWLGKLPAAGLGACDFVCGGGHKLGAPRGIGFLKCPASPRLRALLPGGPQEEGRRAGTENVAGAAALAAALREREQQINLEFRACHTAQRDAFISDLQRHLPGTQIVGEATGRLWNTVLAILPAHDCRRRWVVQLDKLGFAVSTGSACASGKEQPSHVLAAMGCRAEESARALRFSGGWETTAADWQALLGALRTLAERA
jgi:cysteine desulfurase